MLRNTTDRLIEAAKTGDLATIQELRDLINLTDENGNNVLLYAVAYGQIDLARELVKPKTKGGFGLSPKVKNNAGRDLVLTAIAFGQEEMLSLLLTEKKFNLSLKTKTYGGSGPVLTAIAHGQIEMLNILITPYSNGGCNLDLNVKNNNDYGPDEIAAINNQIEMLEFISTKQPLSNILDLLALSHENSHKETFIWLIKYAIEKMKCDS